MDDLDLIKQKINIVDLVSEYLPLKKAGVNFKAPCPFHQEKTPSFVVSPERGIWHCFGCFPPGELVKTPFGYHKIEEIDKNHWVVSGKGKLRKVTDTMIHQYQGDMVTVGLRKLGGNVRLTADHNVYVIRGAPYTKEYKYFTKRYNQYLKIRSDNPTKYSQLVKKYFPIRKMPAGQLQTGDLLLFPINRSESEISNINILNYLNKRTTLGLKPRTIPTNLIVNDDLLKLLGYWIAEGSSHHAYLRFSLGNHEEEFASEIVELIKKIFGLEAKIYRRPNLLKTGLEITACHSQLANIFENLCGKGAANKHIPFIFQELPADKQKVLLEAIHKGDGTSFKANRSKNIHKSVITISKVLAEQLVDILLRLNLFPTKSVKDAYTDKRGLSHKESFNITWSEETKQKYSAIYYEKDAQYWILPIIKLEKENYEGPVYNFTVAYDHSYVATNFAVGNCDKGGDIFKFIMEKEGLEFKDALELLAQKAGITLSGKRDKGKGEKDRLAETNQKASQFFNYMLTSHKLGKNALDYLKKRGLTDDTIKILELGYAPQNWESLTNFLKKRGFTTQEIINSGLGVSSRSGCYDRFRGRIMFPLKDVQSKIIGFSGRILDKGEPKYINSPQTLIFDKSKFLFGIHLAKGDIKQKDEAILVEGEMDMIMSFQSGVQNIVASKGTALTEGQIELLKRYAQTLLLCFDTDLAGDAASRRGIELADQAGLNLKVIQIKGAKDPAELVLTNPKDWEQAVKDAIPIYDYYLQSVQRRFDEKTAMGKKQIFQELLPIWKKISDPIQKDHYIQKLAALLQVKDDLIQKQMEKITTQPAPVSLQSSAVSSQLSDKKAVPEKELPHDRRKMLEEYLIALMLHIPVSSQFIPNFPETLFFQEDLKQIYVLLVLFLDSISFKARSFKIQDFVKDLPPELVETIDRLYLTSIDERLEEEKLWHKEVEMVVQELKKMLIKTSLEKLSLQIKSAQEFEKAEQLDVLNKRFRDLSVKLKNL